MKVLFPELYIMLLLGVGGWWTSDVNFSDTLQKHQCSLHGYYQTN